MKQTNESGKCLTQTTGQAATPGRRKVVNDPLLEPESCIGGKINSKSKVLKHTKSVTQRPNVGNALLCHLLAYHCICQYVEPFWLVGILTFIFSLLSLPEAPSGWNPANSCRYDSSLGKFSSIKVCLSYFLLLSHLCIKAWTFMHSFGMCHGIISFNYEMAIVYVYEGLLCCFTW